MKITERDLMVCDWVMLTDPINNGEKVQVKEIHGDGYITVDGGITKMFAPIPLTSEILEKNGFVKGEEVSDTPPYDQDEEGNMYYSFRGELKFWGWWQPDNTYYIPANAMGDIIIRYVHELQHAMRLAGIDKEITI